MSCYVYFTPSNLSLYKYQLGQLNVLKYYLSNIVPPLLNLHISPIMDSISAYLPTRPSYPPSSAIEPKPITNDVANNRLSNVNKRMKTSSLLTLFNAKSNANSMVLIPLSNVTLIPPIRTLLDVTFEIHNDNFLK